MESLPPPSIQISPIGYAEVQQDHARRHRLPVLHSYTVVEPQRDRGAINAEVRSQLQLFLEALPDPDYFLRQAISQQIHSQIAQVGPVKPNSIPQLKPSDRLRPPIQVNPNPAKEQILKVNSDRQEYDIKTQTFVATGNVQINYKQTEVKADRVQLNIKTQEVVAEGNVFLTRGNQKLRGDKLSFNYIDVQGEMLNASGAVDLGTLVSSEVSRSPADIATNSVTVSLMGTADAAEGQVRRFGFVAERLSIDGDTWKAENLRVTNDPFSPPELEIVTPKATLTPISPTQNRLDLESPTIVFDQGLSIPLPVSTLTLDRFQRFAPALVGFDRRDRDGVFYQQSFDVVTQPNLSFQVSPQILLQRAFSSQSGVTGFDILGVVATLNSAFDDGQKLSARASLSGLNFSRLDSILRFNASHEVSLQNGYNLVSQYAFRDRVFNGSLGFQDVNNLVGSTIFSPTYILGDSQIGFNFQAAVQFVSAIRDDIQPAAVGSLIRVQNAAALSRTFPLLRGIPAPAERESGLRYSPKPIVPKLDAFVVVQGVNSFYSNGNNQATLLGTVGLAAEVGNFAKDFFDYTGLTVSYTQAFSSGRSPFLFDRLVDNRALTAGIVQQIYGPLRLGVQQSWNLDNGNLFDSVYSLEYARRTYAVQIRYNPNQGLGELILRISDFNWTRPPANVTNVQGGLESRN
ncbi:MAG: DUF3769 domain-containing protein [Pseudanabaenaceae cyanobacterium bins.39]|nr:DUF3769 domain-containing protein [Pseudanabaenaceae cyanobacterium bins.39]